MLSPGLVRNFAHTYSLFSYRHMQDLYVGIGLVPSWQLLSTTAVHISLLPTIRPLFAHRMWLRLLDESVSTPLDPEASAARSALEFDALAPLVKFAIYSSKDDSVAYYIGSKLSFKGNASPMGRSTRTFIVFDVLNHTACVSEGHLAN
jgi:hypothetical protein